MAAHFQFWNDFSDIEEEELFCSFSVQNYEPHGGEIVTGVSSSFHVGPDNPTPSFSLMGLVVQPFNLAVDPIFSDGMQGRQQVNRRNTGTTVPVIVSQQETYHGSMRPTEVVVTQLRRHPLPVLPGEPVVNEQVNFLPQQESPEGRHGTAAFVAAERLLLFSRELFLRWLHQQLQTADLRPGGPNKPPGLPPPTATQLQPAVHYCKIANVIRWKEDALQGRLQSYLESDPFILNGCRVCLRVCLKGDGTGRDAHFSVLLVMMRNRCDPQALQRAVITLLDQSTGRGHITHTIHPLPTPILPPPSTTLVSIPEFAPLGVLDNPDFVTGDFLRFRITIL